MSRVTEHIAEATTWWIHSRRRDIFILEHDIIASEQVASSAQCNIAANVLKAAGINLKELIPGFVDYVSLISFHPAANPAEEFWQLLADKTNKTIHLVHNQGMDPFDHTMHTRLMRTISPRCAA